MTKAARGELTFHEVISTGYSEDGMILTLRVLNWDTKEETDLYFPFISIQNVGESIMNVAGRALRHQKRSLPSPAKLLHIFSFMPQATGFEAARTGPANAPV